MNGTINEEKDDNQSIDLRKEIRPYLQNWYWIFLGAVLVLTAAFFYLRYATPVYEVKADLLIKDRDKGGSSLQDDILMDLNLSSSNNKVENEKAILSSRPIIERAIKGLNLQTSYFVSGRIKEVEIYRSSPVFIEAIHLEDSTQVYEFEVTLLDNSTYRLTSEDMQVEARSGDTVQLNGNTYAVKANPGNHHSARTIGVIINPIRQLALSYKKILSLENLKDKSDVINISFKTAVPQKGADFVTRLIQEYMQEGVADKNTSAINTIDFVDDRIDSVTLSLNNIEQRIQDFLSKNGVIDLEQRGQSILDQAVELDRDRMEHQFRVSTLKQIQEQLDKSGEEPNLLSTLGVNDPGLLSLVEKYNTAILDRKSQQEAGVSLQNPIMIRLTKQLEELRKGIRENTAMLLKDASEISGFFDQRSGAIESSVRTAPHLQRQYIDLKRMQETRQELYLYLLKKREESVIAKAATIFNSKVVNPALVSPEPVAPKKKIIYLAAFIIGILIPTGLIYLKGLFYYKIASVDDIKAITKVPVIAEISQAEKESSIIIGGEENRPVIEQFRGLRNNLNFFFQEEKGSKCILVTSSESGEGKSFVSLNLAMTYALLRKKVILLSVDLRKPKLAQYLGTDKGSTHGMSTYLAGQDKLEDVVHPLTINDLQFSFVNAGSIPPNPTELLMRESMQELIERLREVYDYIIIDTPPIGIIPDAQVLLKYADAMLYVVRHQTTKKDMLEAFNSRFGSEELHSKSGIVLNGIKGKIWSRYGSSYGYGYGYGYGYYETERAPWWKFWG